MGTVVFAAGMVLPAGDAHAFKLFGINFFGKDDKPADVIDPCASRWP